MGMRGAGGTIGICVYIYIYVLPPPPGTHASYKSHGQRSGNSNFQIPGILRFLGGVV